MRMFLLAVQNFKSSFRSYVSLILSLAFTILVLYNFSSLLNSGILNQLGETNARNIEICIQVLSFVIGCFMFFFIWYSTNVFLTKRKKEIGIYAFMGLSNQKIGKLYMIETMLIGCVSLLLGIIFGILTSQLFVMILMAISSIAIDIHFSISLSSILSTSLIFLVMYMIFVGKGYINIVRSSVLSMLNANRQNEYVKQNIFILLIKAIFGIGFMAAGFYLATKDAGMEVMFNVLSAVIFVVIGIYFIFGGFLPLCIQALTKRKRFLYKKERTLWINSIVFRMKKNYRTLAIVCVLTLCSITALAFGFAMKNRYNSMVHFENTYTFQILSDRTGRKEEFKKDIEKQNTVTYASAVEVNVIDKKYTNTTYSTPVAVIPYSQIKTLAKDTNMEFALPMPSNDEYIELHHIYLMSLTNDSITRKEMINGIDYTSIKKTATPYLGYLQENMDYMIVNDEVYEQMKPLGQSFYMYNYKIKQPENFAASVESLQANPHCHGLVKIDPNREDIKWIKILYSVSIFVFMVFVFASGSILFMKLYNDAFDEKERFDILKKIGVSHKVLKKSIAKELAFSYVSTLFVMSISSYFSVKAIGNLMQASSLLSVNVISALIIYAFFFLCYLVSNYLYQKQLRL